MIDNTIAGIVLALAIYLIYIWFIVPCMENYTPNFETSMWRKYMDYDHDKKGLTLNDYKYEEHELTGAPIETQDKCRPIQ